MRVFTDGACINNGRPGAKAGYAAWFPENTEWSSSHRVPENEVQTNQRAELRGIDLAVQTLIDRLGEGTHDEELYIYTDSEYCINCLTKWILKWHRNDWKTSTGGEVLHRDLIEGIAKKTMKFKTHVYRHVKAHTGGTDDLSRNNDVVDRMANSSVDPSVKVVEREPMDSSDELLPGCPLKILGSPVAHTVLTDWMRINMHMFPKELLDKHLYKAFAEHCKEKGVTLTKRVLNKTSVVRAERDDLQITKVEVTNTE